jgi:spore germination protein YaaH
MVRHRLARALAAFLLAASTLPVAAPVTVAAAPTPLRANQLSHRLTAEVMGYLPYWEMNDETVANLDYHRLTTIAFFSVGMDADGHLVTSGAGYKALLSDRATTVIERAHAAGVRAIVSFTSFGAERNAAFFSNQAAQDTFVAEAAALVKARGLDGADLDVELISGTYFAAYAATAGALADRMRADNAIAFSSVATNGNTSGARMARRALAAGVDRAFLMGYNYRSAGTSPVGSIDPLVHVDGGLSLTASLDMYADEGVPLNRVILGLPFYGRTWHTTTANLHAARVSGEAGVVFRFEDLSTLLAEGTVLAHDLDTIESSARLVRNVDGAIYQTYYDSPASFLPKFKLVFSRGLAGVGFWALGYDGGEAGYWNLVGSTFGPPVISSVRIEPNPTNDRAVTVWIRWTNHDRPVTEMRLANGSGTFSAWRPVAGRAPGVRCAGSEDRCGIATEWTLPASTSPVKRYVQVQVRDEAGALSTIRAGWTLLDPTKPRLTKVTLWWSTTANAWRLKYVASDTGSGVGTYRIRIEQAGVWSDLAVGYTGTSYTIRLPRSAEFRVSVSPIDKAGNVGAPVYRST